MIGADRHGLLDSECFSYGIGPSINVPIFDPSIDANIKVSEAEKKTAEEEYRLTVINAFQEVENALVNLHHYKKQRREIEERKKRLEQVAAQIRAQLKVGIVSQLRVFETERTLLQASQDLLTNHQQILSVPSRFTKPWEGVAAGHCRSA